MVGLGEVVDAASRWVDEHKRGIAYGTISDVESLMGYITHYLFSGLYAAVALGGGLVLRSIRVTAQFRLCLKSHPFFNNLTSAVSRCR